MKKMTVLIAILALPMLLGACTPEPGTKAWCEVMKEKEKADWSGNDAATYAKYCVMGNYKE